MNNPIKDLEIQLNKISKEFKKLEARVDGLHKSAINTHTDVNKLAKLIKNFGNNITKDFYND